MLLEDNDSFVYMTITDDVAYAIGLHAIRRIVVSIAQNTRDLPERVERTMCDDALVITVATPE